MFDSAGINTWAFVVHAMGSFSTTQVVEAYVTHKYKVLLPLYLSSGAIGNG